jgi:hypothetical protein
LAAATIAVFVLVPFGSRPAAFRPAADTPGVAEPLKAVMANAANALPGATAAITSPAAGTGDILSITAPPAAFTQPGAGHPGFPAGPAAAKAHSHGARAPASRAQGAITADVIDAGNAGWRAGMIGAFAAANDPAVVGWTLESSGAAMSSAATNYLHAYVRMSPGSTVGWPSLSLIGRVSAAAAQRQLASNLEILRSVLRSDLIASTTSVVPVGPTTFGIEVDLEVTNLAAIASHVSDVWLGLTTGLTGGPNAAVEGLAINVVDASGARASVWRNGRDGDGGGVGNPALPPATMTDVAFPDLTGGPALSASASSGAASLPPRSHLRPREGGSVSWIGSRTAVARPREVRLELRRSWRGADAAS